MGRITIIEDVQALEAMIHRLTESSGYSGVPLSVFDEIGEQEVFCNNPKWAKRQLCIQRWLWRIVDDFKSEKIDFKSAQDGVIVVAEYMHEINYFSMYAKLLNAQAQDQDYLGEFYLSPSFYSAALFSRLEEEKNMLTNRGYM